MVQAVLFEGPPGTGKTTCARIVAQRATVPLVYVPLESVASKWYGESEQKLSAMLNQAEDLSGGCIIFLDEERPRPRRRSSAEIHMGAACGVELRSDAMLL